MIRVDQVTLKNEVFTFTLLKVSINKKSVLEFDIKNTLTHSTQICNDDFSLITDKDLRNTKRRFKLPPLVSPDGCRLLSLIGHSGNLWP